ncbi:glycosyltransferase 87 family protein [Streptomyces sp. LP05-1]|uniref:Glycosyltransferase 87 family protein n=1 Tax=Streptomyces pyxinae TaxID=2970734 RepID=A0ABT2CG05_9ACTN|nr:glycosyltransferase 87 family protein [Streptomyces sp. LP05-1]MCS0636352.1 glycosyltransferase 87 family protein [Streptomyces sp. LP05-1]
MKGPRAAIAVWLLTRAVLLLSVFSVFRLPGPDVTTDISVIYRGWYEVLSAGSYPLADVTWQYPPAAAYAVLSPGLLPFLDYAHAFFLLAFASDAVAFGLLVRAGGRPGKCLSGAWVWIVGLPLLGPTAYARYDVMVTAVAVAALLAGVRHPRTLGALAGLGALLKVWPVLLLAGTRRGRATRRSWTAAAVSGAVVLGACAAAMPGALAFLTFQRDRGTEVESLGALFFHVVRHLGWEGEARLNYGSVEFLGPYVPVVSALALALTAGAFGWLLVWRLRAREFGTTTLVDAAFVAVLLFVTTSRVISPQYLLWLVGLAAVCLVFRGSPMRPAARLVLVATGVTLLEFPIWFSHVVDSDPLGLLLLTVRNGLLVAASVSAGRVLWRRTVTEPRLREPVPVPAQPVRRADLTPAAPADEPATGR